MEPVSLDWAGAVEQELRRLQPGGGADDLVSRSREQVFPRLPPGYQEQTAPAEAAWDCMVALELGTGTGSLPPAPGPGQSRLSLVPSRRQGTGDFRLRRAGRRRVELSSLLPVLANFGLVVVEAVPWHFAGGDGRADFYVDDIGLRLRAAPSVPGVDGAGPGPAPEPLAQAGLGTSADAARLIEAIDAVAAGLAEAAPLDGLVITAGLGWREVNLLSAYCRYRFQAGGPRSAEKADAMARALVLFPAAAAAAVGLFKARLGGPGGDEESVRAARAAMGEALAQVPDLEHDEALHELVSMVEATTRSTWALGGPVIAVKLASEKIPFLPPPRPFAEIYVWSTWFEGLHLRFGPVARGGIRWSERTADLRGEVLGLARAQVKKNSLIIPTGAKGAFCLRAPADVALRRAGRPLPGPPTGTPRAGALQARSVPGPDQGLAGRAAYEAFVGAMLDLTDNIVDGSVAHPPLVCLDGDDPYLVVAADKGTASFSDLANSVSETKGFWLGDAFASGGSQGYDHKALGITAKGAWLAVRRHFRALGMDPDTEELRVAGVGDMSGDVFGNAMLQSRHLKLVAAFDHRHIFLDPGPDAEVAFDERLRLSRLRTSSWADYDMAKASPGAAVFSRRAKQAELSPQARAVLGPVPAALSPPELVRAVLAAPVDLLFFGGIGTFVRGTGEDDADVEDHANDDVRLDAKDLRARVIAEGANLALTERARAAYSRRGGRVNADFVDNAAGVALSDREVNMKILLGLAMAAGRLDMARRRQLMSEAQGEAARSVLAQVEGGMVALDRAASASASALPAYEDLLRDLEADGLLDREVEALPADEELARRAQAGAGFSRPELAVLVAYARSELARDIERSPLARGMELSGLVAAYFPAAVRDGLDDLAARHPLASQLAASQLANEILEQMGPVWAHESASETGRDLHEVAAAYWAARRVLRAGDLMAALADEAPWWPLEAEYAARDCVAGALGRLARWYLVHSGPLEVGTLIASGAGILPLVADLLPLDEALLGELGSAGVPAPRAEELARLEGLSVVGEVGSVSQRSGRAPAEALEAMGAVAQALNVGPLGRRLTGTAPADRWDRRQLHVLADDLGRGLAATATAALSSAAAGAKGAEAVSEFLGRRPRALQRSAALSRLGAAPGPVNYSLLALAVRAVCDMATTATTTASPSGAAG